MSNAAQNIAVMIYFIFVLSLNHIMQIMQECLEYNLMTNSVKFTQQTCLPRPEGDKSVCNLYLLQSTYVINSPKVKAGVENVHTWCKHKLADVYTIHWYELHQ